MTDCVFCRLVEGQAEVSVVYGHLHVFPRHQGDGFGLQLPPNYSVRPRVELDQTARVLVQAWPSRRVGHLEPVAQGTFPITRTIEHHLPAVTRQTGKSGCAA